MRIVDDILAGGAESRRPVITIGSFDGVHMGHQRILEEVLKIARDLHSGAAVLTMRPHPRELFCPDHPPNLLTTEKKKFELFEKLGVDAAYVLPFTRDVARMAPETFASEILRGKCRARHVVVGHDFSFGCHGAGDYARLVQLGTELDFTVTQVQPLIIGGERVSSTAIRERLLQGDLRKAEVFLGRKYSIVGKVVSGRGIGVQLGFPTANIKPYHTAVPAQGVYAAQVQLNGNVHSAAVNIGIAPTIAHEDTVIEAHIIDFDGDLRGREIEIVFHERLRPEKKFASRDELVEAIHADVEGIRRYFASL
jgi:riboflavin kinase/FMN adenylyltransferase